MALEGDIMYIDQIHLRHLECAFPLCLHYFEVNSAEASILAGKALTVPVWPFFDIANQRQIMW